MDGEALVGGRVTEGVVRIGDTVRRPHGPHSGYVRELLDQLERSGFDGAPRALGRDDQGRDVYSFIPGEVPLDLGLFSDVQLRSAFELLRRFHDATAGSALAGAAEVVCHGDVSPCNISRLSPDGPAGRADRLRYRGTGAATR